MIRRGDRDGVNILVFEQLSNIHEGFWFWHAQLLHVPEALVQDAFIHVAQSGNFCPWDTVKTVNVIFAAASHTANSHPHTIIRADDPGIAESGDAQSRAGGTCAGDFQEVPPGSI